MGVVFCIFRNTHEKSLLTQRDDYKGCSIPKNRDRFSPLKNKLYSDEIPNFTLELDELNNDFDRWIYVLKNMHRLQDLPDKLKTKIFEKVFDIAEVSNLSKEEMRAYSKSQKTIWDNYAVMESARLEGMEKGRKVGREEGREEGMEKGIEKGKQEGIKIMVLNFHKAGAGIEMISEASGLSHDEINKILEENPD